MRVIQHLMAILVFMILPSFFWGGIFYTFVNPTLGRIAFLLMFISGAYTCIKGRKNQYKCQTKKSLSQLKNI